MTRKGDSIMQPSSSTLPTSEHFELKQIEDGVYAAIGVMNSNGGIIDLGGQTLIFDTFESHLAAADLRAAAETLTGRPVTYVIISHAHADHWCGNQAFGPETPTITTHATREEMPEAIGWLQELKENPSEIEQAIHEDRRRLEQETDARQRASLELSIRRMGRWLTELPGREIHLPNQTFGGKLIFHGAQRMAELTEVAPGHTVSDAYLLLPKDQIVFMGDLGFFQCQPFMVYCDPEAWVAHLEEMEESDVETFVPGHGPLGTKVDLSLQGEYILIVQELVAKAVQDGMTVEETLLQPLSEPFGAWLHGGMARWEANVRSVHERLSSAMES
jgi:cyclase